MSTYYNCYELLAEVRRGINEHSTGKVNGTDTSGAFPNEMIIKKINDAQTFLFNLLFKRMPFLWLTSTDLTGSASEYTLPADFFKLRRWETSDNVKIKPISVDERHLNEDEGSKYLYYRAGLKLRIDKDGTGDTCKLWYFKRPRRITMGSASAGGALSITLASSARKEADYYNSMTIEDVTADFAVAISDYSATRVATIAQTAASADYYGIVSEIPEEFHHLIGERAILYMKMLPQSNVPIGRTEYEMFKEDLVETYRAYCGDMEEGDVMPEDVFMSLEPFVP